MTQPKVEIQQVELQKVITPSPRSDLIVEGIQMVSGLLLVLFLWVHMLFVASIWLGSGAFNVLANFMVRYGLVWAAVIFLILVIGSHVGAVVRRIPKQFREQRIVWRHAKLIRHMDTWSWIFQSITGAALLALVIIHVAVVTYGGISAQISSSRVFNHFLVFYVVLLILAEYHASVGLYRIFVKWGWVSQHRLHRVLGVITVLTVGIGAVSLYVLYALGAHFA
ncbi:succinate dehydrogenase/fumarate reductase transmembrane subunit [Alicyclobacillus mengziensis]|uniref:Succinate dehydrogenase n=1 Tax=Alicyclobacillus mengziensis TaxID=2931921 RepID=A0A9X7VYM8_9BACL|nr:hypothetical protein [Alicyclobacillus mengziensis]QSO47451.1 hypothetical protein JZ786_24220 [Alicyclobacillus mengziensis]